MKLFKDTFQNNDYGVWLFVPKDEAAYRAKKPCKGFGVIRYPEGSVYMGDIYFDGKEYNKLGYGQQDFSRSNIGYYNAAIDAKLYKYVGHYDYRETDWICGNGTLYFTDREGNPKYFVRGYYRAIDRQCDMRGKMETSLLHGWTPDMERSFSIRQMALDSALAKAKNIEGDYDLFVGDSYLQYWMNSEYAGEDLFYDRFPNAHNLNIGIGGSAFGEWRQYYLNQVEGLPAPKRIFFNLGFNDLHSGITVEKVMKNCRTVLEWFRSRYPEAEIFFAEVVAAPRYPQHAEREERLNRFFYRLASTQQGISVIPLREAIAVRHAEAGCFHSDEIHLNANGYRVYTEAVQKIKNS